MIAQVIAGTIVLATYRLLAEFGIGTPTLALLAGQGGLAASVGRMFGLDWWWVPIHLAFPFAMWMGLTIALPAWLYLTLFFALLLVFSASSRDRVPLYLTNKASVEAIAELLPAGRTFRMIDLGCGIGGPIRRLARKRPDGSFVGVEAAPATFALAWLRCRGVPNIELRLGDLWNVDLSGHDIVYCFLSPAPMSRLFQKARSEMKPDSMLISNSFMVDGEEPCRVVEVGDARRTRLYLWRMATGRKTEM